MGTLQPLGFGVILPGDALSWIYEEIWNANDVGAGDAVCRAKLAVVPGDDIRPHPLFARRSLRDEEGIPPRRGKEIEHAIERGGCDLRNGKDRHIQWVGLFNHGRNDRFLAFSTLVTVTIPR